MKEIIKILNNYKFVKKEFFAFIIVGILMESGHVLFPQFAKKIIGVIEKKGSLDDLYFWVIGLGIFTFMAVFMTFIFNYFQNKIWLLSYSRKSQFYREEIFNKNYKDILDIGTGKLLTRLNNGVTGEIDIFRSLLNIIISAIFRGILVIIIITFYIPELIPMILLAIIILFVINYNIRNYIKKYNKTEQELWETDGKNSALLIMENLVIRVFGKKDYELKKSKKTLDKIPFYGTKVDTANNLFYQFLEFLLRLLELGVYIIIGTLIIKEGNLEISYLIMLTSYIWFLWWPLDKAISNMNHINKVWEKYKKLQEFIEKPNDINNGEEIYKYKNGKIEIKNLEFEYSEDKKIFKNLNLNFLEGKKNAIVGHSGGGKSTIIKILLRLYDYKNGDILIDGQELKTLKIESFYKEIGYLPQEPGIFDGTIRENMEYAFEKRSGQTEGTAPTKNSRGEPCIHPENNQEKQIWQALEKAQISEMIKKLKKGLDTEVGEKGVKLSGGEKQRLAIARIFLKNPKIIILDEPTSALDSISESGISKAIDEIMKNRTSIVIAHRLQTVMHSDKIIVLEDGKIESEGKHNELMKDSEVYKTLVDLQNGKIIE